MILGGLTLVVREDEFRNELREWFYVLPDAGVFQRLHVVGSRLDGDHGPGVAAGCKHEVHQEPAYTPVTVPVWMDEYEEEMAEHDANSC